MLYIKRGQTNNMVVTASQSTTISPAYYLFSFVHILSKETYNFFPQLISTNARYDEFRFVEAQAPLPNQTPPQVNFLYEGDYYYYVYEMSTTGSTNPNNAVGLLENGRALVSGNTQDDCFYQFVSDNENNSNYIFLSDCERPETLTPTPTSTHTPTPTPTPTDTTPCVQYQITWNSFGNFTAYASWNDCDGNPQTYTQFIIGGGSLTRYLCAEAGSVIASGANFNTITNIGACQAPGPTPSLPPPTPSQTQTNTPTPTQTPTLTLTPTPSSTCPLTTQYLEVLLQDNTKFKMSLYNDASFTSPADALCDYTISGYAVGDMGTIYAGTEQILQGQHNKQFDLAPVLQPGEIVIDFAPTAYWVNGCECPLFLILP